MPRMRHPNVAAPYDALDVQVSSHRMTGWLTEDEAPELFAAAAEREQAEAAEAAAEQADGTDEEPQDDPPEASGEQKSKARRPRSRGTSEGNED